MIWYKQREAIISIVIISLVSFVAGLAAGSASTSSKAEQSVAVSDKTEQSIATSDSPAPTEPIEPINLSGTGRLATEKFELKAGLITAKYTYEGEGNFSVTLMDSNGEYAGLLANELGTSTGSSAHQIRSAGPYLIDVNADGPWTVEITQ